MNKILLPLRFKLIKQVFIDEVHNPKEFTYGTYYLIKNNENYEFFIEEKGKRDTFFKKFLYFFEKPFNKMTRLGMPLELYYLHKEQFSNAGKVLCINDAISLAMLYLKKKKKINSQIITLFQSLSERHKVFRYNLPIQFFLKQLIKKSSLILTLSQVAREKLIEQYQIKPEKIKVFYFGADTHFWQYKDYQSRERDLILTIGNDMNRDYQLLDYGLAEHYAITAITRKKIKNKKVIQKKNLSFVEVRQHYYQARLVIIPNKSVLSESPGLSCTVQAMACGTPVVIADSPAIRELFTENESIFFYEPGIAASLKSVVDYIWNKHELLKKVSHNARQLIEEKYNYQHMERQMLEILEINEMDHL